jgi:hypothetical protein
VRTNLKLLTGFFVNVRAGKDGVLFDARRERNRAPNDRAGAFSGFNDFKRALIKRSVIVGFHTNSDDGVVGSRHCNSPFFPNLIDKYPESAPIFYAFLTLYFNYDAQFVFYAIPLPLLQLGKSILLDKIFNMLQSPTNLAKPVERKGAFSTQRTSM